MKDNNQSKPVHETACMESHAGNVILHISDLHFLEVPTTKQIGIGRELILLLEDIDPEWNPNIVCITGDISDKNNSTGYCKAEKWINELLVRLKLTPENLIMCPGNHDVDTQKAKKIECPKKPEEVEDHLKIPIPSEYEDLFSSYNTLSEKLRTIPLNCNGRSSYLFGVHEINGVNFIVCNSCWFYKDGEIDKNCISTGLPLLECLENEYEFCRLKQNSSTKVIALIHHPKEGLSWWDTARYNNRPTLAVLTEMSSLVLTGHLHSLNVGKSEYNSTPFLNCGATLQDRSDVNNTFALIRVEEGRFIYQFYRTDLTQGRNRWVKDGDPEYIICDQPQAIINRYFDQKGSVSSLEDKISGSISKMKRSEPEPTDIPIPIELTPTSTATLDLDIGSVFELIKRSLNKAETHIKRLEFMEAFRILDVIEEDVKPLKPSTQSKTLSDIYTRISLIECTRANCLHIEKGTPADYSVAKEYLMKAKKADGKQ